MSEENKQLGNNPKGDVGEQNKDIALPPVKQKVKKGGRVGKGGPPKDTGKPEHG
jgi:hypothetical protein